METHYVLIDQAYDIFKTCKEDKLWTNLQILNNFKILHAFNTPNFPELPTDYQTTYLIFEFLYLNQKAENDLPN